MFFFMIMISGLIGTGYTSFRLLHRQPLRFGYKVLITVFILACWFMPAFIRDRGVLSGVPFIALSYIGYFLFVFFFLLFIFLITRDIIWFCIRFIQKRINPTLKPVSSHFLRQANLITLIITLTLTTYSLYEGTKVPDLKEITLYSDKIQEPVQIVLLTDLHLSRSLSQTKLDGIIDRVNNLHPDIILLAGDIIDDQEKHIQNLVQSMSRLKAKSGVFATSGNHEFYVGHDQVLKNFKKMNVIYLFNEGHLTQKNVFIAGIPDHKQVRRIQKKADIRQALTNAPSTAYKILLSHTPSFIDQLTSHQIDLQVSGHTHGGQIFPFHYLAWLFNGYLNGLYTVNGMKLYVSRGSGQWGPQMRFLAPSEITLIRLSPLKHQEN